MNGIEIKKIRYIPGLDRNATHAKSHLYRGTFDDPGWPMCAAGWSRDAGTSYSIFRNSVPNGICRDCWENAKAGLDPVPPADHGNSTSEDTMADDYLKQRREQANEEAQKGTNLPHVESEMSGTVTNPGDTDASQPAGDSTVIEADASVDSSGPDFSGAPGGLTATESPVTGSQRTTRETGVHRRP